MLKLKFKVVIVVVLIMTGYLYLSDECSPFMAILSLGVTATFAYCTVSHLRGEPRSGE